MSFQKAHNISNELAEVVVTTGVQTINAWGGVTLELTPNVAADGRGYRVIELGYTIVNSATGAGQANCFSFGIFGSAGTFVLSAAVPAVPAVPFATGTVFSTARGGTLGGGLTFIAAGTGNIDSDGVPFLNAGEVLTVSQVGQTAAVMNVTFFARLAPVVSRDVFA